MIDERSEVKDYIVLSVLHLSKGSIHFHQKAITKMDCGIQD